MFISYKRWSQSGTTQLTWAGIAQSVQRLATGWTIRGSNPSGAIFSAPVRTGPGVHSASYIMGTGSFQGVKRPGRGIDHPPHLAPRLKKQQSYTSAPPLGLRGLLQSELYLYLQNTVNISQEDAYIAHLLSITRWFKYDRDVYCFSVHVP